MMMQEPLWWWYFQDVLISISSVIVMPLVSWRIWVGVNVPVIRQLTTVGVCWVLYCVINGLAHLNWAYMPSFVPQSVMVLHTATTVGNIVFAVSLIGYKDSIVKAINRQWQPTPIISDQMRRRLAALSESPTPEGADEQQHGR
jgi:hypothetical protein